MVTHWRTRAKLALIMSGAILLSVVNVSLARYSDNHANPDLKVKGVPFEGLAHCSAGLNNHLHGDVYIYYEPRVNNQNWKLTALVYKLRPADSGSGQNNIRWEIWDGDSNSHNERGDLDRDGDTHVLKSWGNDGKIVERGDSEVRVKITFDEVGPDPHCNDSYSF